MITQIPKWYLLISFGYELVAIPRGNASIVCGASYHVWDLPSVIICYDVAKDPSDRLSPLTSAKSYISESRYLARYFPANIPWPMTDPDRSSIVAALWSSLAQAFTYRRMCGAWPSTTVLSKSISTGTTHLQPSTFFFLTETWMLPCLQTESTLSQVALTNTMGLLCCNFFEQILFGVGELMQLMKNICTEVPSELFIFVKSQ